MHHRFDIDDYAAETPLSSSLEFAEALREQGIQLPEDQISSLTRYAELLWEWNEKINLTRHTTWQLFASRDMLDVTQLAALIPEGVDVLDLGSGGGVPGIPLSIIRPDLNVSLCESVGKKAQVLNEIVTDLDLPITVFAARAESLLDDLQFDTIVVRAVGSLRKLCTWVEPHWTSIGQILAIKGPKWLEERNEARPSRRDEWTTTTQAGKLSVARDRE